MVIVHVHVHVVPGGIDAFRIATLANARESVREPGVARFDVIQQEDDPARFELIEIYRTSDAVAAHKATAHYLTWRDAVAPLMAEARTSTKYRPIFPEWPGT